MKISTLKALDALKESKLEDLVLKGNPFRDIEGLREESAYVRYQFFSKHSIHDDG